MGFRGTTLIDPIKDPLIQRYGKQFSSPKTKKPFIPRDEKLSLTALPPKLICIRCKFALSQRCGNYCSDTLFPLTLEVYGPAYSSPQGIQPATQERTSVNHALKTLPVGDVFSL